MKIKLTKQNTVSTCLAARLAPQPGTEEYYMKAVKSGGKTVQHVGKATVYPNGLKPWQDGNGRVPGLPPVTPDDLKMFIIVETCNGTRLGKAMSKKEARQMIHNHHKANPLYIGHNEELE